MFFRLHCNGKKWVDIQIITFPHNLFILINTLVLFILLNTLHFACHACHFWGTNTIYLSVFCGTNLNSDFLTHSLLGDNKLYFLSRIIPQLWVLYCKWQYYIQWYISFVKQKKKKSKNKNILKHFLGVVSTACRSAAVSLTCSDVISQTKCNDAAFPRTCLAQRLLFQAQLSQSTTWVATPFLGDLNKKLSFFYITWLNS